MRWYSRLIGCSRRATEGDGEEERDQDGALEDVHETPPPPTISTTSSTAITTPRR